MYIRNADDDEMIETIAKIIMGWGFKVKHGVEYPGTQFENILFRVDFSESHVYRRRYVRIVKDMLTVESGTGAATLLNVPLGSPDSIGRLKGVLENGLERS